MDKKKFILLGIFTLIIVVLGVLFVFADIVLEVEGLYFSQNTTATYDNDGTVALNWSADVNATSYNITIWADGVSLGDKVNDSVIGYTYTNASTESNFTFNVAAVNLTGKGPASSNISILIDTIDPDIEYNPTTETDNGGANRTWIFVNITVTETNNDTATFHLYNSTGAIPAGLVYSNSSNYNLSEPVTINWTGLTNDNAYHFNVLVNDSANNSDESSDRTFYLDGTAPTSVTLTESSSTKTSLTLTIATDDALSGIASSCTAVGSGTKSISGTGASQTLTVTGLGCGNTYSYTITCTDRADNSKSSSSTSFSTSSCTSGGTAPTYEWAFQKTHAWSKITPGTAAIMKDFDKEIGLKQIQIEVNNEAQNVKITVTKYDGKPANVSVQKSGKVYNYLQIETENLGDKLEKGIITIRVNKSWVSDNALEEDDIALFRFNNVSEEWDELDTTYVEADDEYYYYDAEVDSFSYFAISEKVVVSDENGEEGEETKKGLGWWWVAIIAGVIIIAYLVSANKREISELFKK